MDMGMAERPAQPNLFFKTFTSMPDAGQRMAEPPPPLQL